MNSKRLYQTLVGAIALSILGLIGGAYVLNNMLSKQAETLKSQRVEIAVLDGQQQGLTKAKEDIATYQSLAEIAKSIVPQDKDQAQTVGEIAKLAKANGIVLSRFSFPTSDLGGTSSAAAALSQLSPVPGIAGVYGLQITVDSDKHHPAPYSDFIHFLQDLENNRRTTLVQSVTINPSVDDPSYVSFSLTLEEYIKP